VPLQSPIRHSGQLVGRPVFCSHVDKIATFETGFSGRLHENSINELIADEH
jgi:hypothetical protein